ncbi:DNA cytosine methyltransferase, partial [Rhodanobacter denitrificans]|nr:DNA cytosine methyltransferase [Rhodanobacter denitrificans]
MRAIDLFAGVGGLSEGARQAGCTTVWAGNHNAIACEYFQRNHGIKPYQQDLQQANWTLVPQHDLLLAAPACQGHTPARGKERPHHDACRSTAWAVVSALECHRTPLAIVENVPAFLRWSLFPAWRSALTALGYAVAPHVIDFADLGVPQHRKRTLIVLSRSKHPIELQLPRFDHVPASSIIDFVGGRWSPIVRPGRA